MYHYRKPRLGRQVTDYDLFSPTFKADPFPTYAAMRARDPVYAHLAPDGRTIWYVTRYEDVAAVLKDDQRFCKNPMNAQAAGGLPSNKGGAHTRPHQLINQNMLFSDPPDHTRLRALVSQAFTPRRVAAVAERIRETAGRLIERMAADGRLSLIHI